MNWESGLQRHKPDVRRTGPGGVVEVDHWHDELEFNLVLGGHGTYFVPEGQYDLIPGTLVWLLPGQRHRLMRSPDFDMWVVTVDPQNLEAEFFDDIRACACCTLATEDVIALDRLLCHVSQDMDEPGLYSAGLEYAARSARHISMNSIGPVRKPPHPAVLAALSFLRENAEIASMAALARMCGVSPDYLSQLLVSQTGRRFVEWRNRMRLERFHILYPESHDLLTAALAAGFGSYTQFHRVFLNFLGVTPGEWAKSRGPSGPPAPLTTSSLPVGADRPGVRMIWYRLNEFALPTISRHFARDFAESFQTRAGTCGAVECGPVSADAFAALVDEILADITIVDAEMAQALTRILTRHNLFEDYITTFGNFGFSVTDLSEMFGLYLALADAAANGRSMPSRATIGGVIDRVRHALQTTGAIETVCLAERRRLIAALILQMMFLRGAYLAARSSGSEVTMKRVSDGARHTAMALFGLDLRTASPPKNLSLNGVEKPVSSSTARSRRAHR